MRFGFIEEHRFTFPIGRMCHVMNVSARGLRAFRNRPASRRQRSDLVTLAHIKEQSRLSLGSYGRPRTVFVKQVVRRFHAASLISEALLSRSGFSQTGPVGCQLRVLPDQRSGFCARAFA